MKKSLAFLLAFLLMLSLPSCGSKKKTEADPVEEVKSDPADVNWWGQYRGGQGILGISNYDENPEGDFYFHFVLEGEDDAADGVAVITSTDYCEAAFENFIFVFNHNDSVIPDTNPDNDSITISGGTFFDGEYVRCDEADPD